MIDEASDLRIAIGRVLGEWMLELAQARAGAGADPVRVAQLEQHIEQIKSAVRQPERCDECGALLAYVVEGRQTRRACLHCDADSIEQEHAGARHVDAEARRANAEAWASRQGVRR